MHVAARVEPDVLRAERVRDLLERRRRQAGGAHTQAANHCARFFGTDGDRSRGFWEVDEVQPPHRLVFRDGFANEDGTPNTELPMTTARVSIQEIGGGRTRMSIESEFPTVEAMEQLAALGMEEGMTQAVGQIDAILGQDANAR